MDFKSEMRKEARERGASLDRVRFEGLEKEEVKAEREEYWEENLEAAAGLAGVDLEESHMLHKNEDKSLHRLLDPRFFSRLA